MGTHHLYALVGLTVYDEQVEDMVDNVVNSFTKT